MSEATEKPSTATEVPWMDEIDAMVTAANIIISYDLVDLMQTKVYDDAHVDDKWQVMADYTLLELAVKDLLHYAAQRAGAPAGARET